MTDDQTQGKCKCHNVIGYDSKKCENFLFASCPSHSAAARRSQIPSSIYLRIFLNQLFRNQTDKTELYRDLQAIRMASVNPILDPWIYILLRKTVFLKLMEKIKCLFCKMGGRGRSGGGHFLCADGHLSSSIVSRDSPSLMSRELREMVSTSHTMLYPSERNTQTHGPIQAGVEGDSTLPAIQTLQTPQEVDGSKSVLEDSVLEMPLKELPVCPKDPALQVTFTDETADMQEKCI